MISHARIHLKNNRHEIASVVFLGNRKFGKNVFKLIICDLIDFVAR